MQDFSINNINVSQNKNSKIIKENILSKKIKSNKLLFIIKFHKYK